MNSIFFQTTAKSPIQMEILNITIIFLFIFEEYVQIYTSDYK